MDFIKKYWIPIIAGIIGITAGYFANVYANKMSEKRIIDALTAEIEALKAKQQTGRITFDDQKRIVEIESQLKILNSL